MEYIVEKFIDGQWWYEGKGNIGYVNKMIYNFMKKGIEIRIKEKKMEDYRNENSKNQNQEFIWN